MKFEGEIGEIRVLEHLVEMGRERFTGAVRFENDGIIKIIYFKGGDVLSASTNDRADSIDEILLHAGKVTREHIKQALGKRKENETLGDALLNLGFITRKELTWARRAQVIGVIRSITAWTAGQFTVVADYLPKREEGTLFPLSQIIVELVVTDQERQTYERALDGGNAVFQKITGFDDAFRSLGLNEDAEAIAAQIDGQRSAADIASGTGKDSFNVYKLLHAFALLGLIERVGAEVQASPEISFQTEDDIPLGGAAAVADAAEMWESAAAPLREEPSLGLGLDFPTAPAMTQAPADAAAAAQEVAPLPDWDLPEPASTPGVPPPAAKPEAAPAAKAKWDVPAVPPAATASGEQWGFDEAQLDASRRATAAQRSADRLPPSMRQASMKQTVKKAAKPNRWIAILIGAVALIAIAFGGIAGWNWWQARSSTATAQVTPVQRPKRRVAPPAVTATDTTATVVPASDTTGTVVPLTATSSTATTTQPVTKTVPPAAATIPPPVNVPQVAANMPPTGTRVEQRPAGATITNAGAAPRDAQRAHFDEMARKFAAQPTGNYTVQFELVCEPASLTTAIKQGGEKVWFVPFSYKGRACYRVFWGHYATQAEATAAKEQIPVALRGAPPVVVSAAKINP